LIDDNENLDDGEKILKSKNLNLKQSKNLDNAGNNLNEFTFKKSVIENSKMKLSLNNNMEIEETEQINNFENTSNLSEYKKQRDPLVNDYPLEITNTLEDDYSKLNPNNLDSPDL
jgi:hypothetical protein